MSKFDPTDEQDEVLSFNGKNMIVSASAGSGKTATIVEFISQLVKAGQPIKRILLLTFTRAASFEMKERLIANLYEEATNDIVLSAIDDVPTADISTIHSFLGNVIRRNTNILPINDGFVVLDEEELSHIKEMAFASSEKLYKEKSKEEYESLFLRFHSNRQTIFSLLENMLAFFATIENPREKIEKWKSSQKEIYKITMKAIVDLFLPQLSSVRSEMTRLKSFLDDEKYTLYINNFERLLSSDKKPFDLLKDVALSNLKAPTTSKKVNPLALEELKVQYKLFKELKDDLLSINIDDERLYDEKEFGVLENQIYDFYLIYEKELEREKEKINGVDFNDLEKFAKELLENEEIKSQIQQDYDYIFIDEYQDTNYVQASIVKEIAKAAHFIAVGDPKQGIYGFRNATSEIIKQDIKDFDKAEDSAAQYLRKNFRSDPNILTFVNDVFVNVMKEETVGINYQKTSVLKAGKEKGHLFDKNLPAVRVDIIKKEKEEKENNFQEIYDITKDTNFKGASKSLEAKVIANRVQEIMLHQIYDCKQEVMRPVSYRDICILTRGRSELVEEIIKELSSKEIPVVSEIRGNFKDYSEILVLINLFKVLLDFKDDTSLLSVMLSKIGGFSVDEVAKLRLEDDKEFFNIIKNSSEEKVVSFRNLLESLKFKMEVKGAYVMLEELFKEVDYRPYILSKPNAENYLFVLDKFLEKIKTCGAEYDLPRLVSLLEQEEIDFKGGGNSSNAVSICTIHSSKGLEYPVVILADGGKTILETSKEPFVLDEDFGLALNFYSQDEDKVLLTPLVYLLKNKAKEKAWSDEIMLLYVALTRAQRHLYITGTLKENALTSLPEDPTKAKSYLELILSSHKQLVLPQSKEELLSKRVEVNEISEIEDVFAKEMDFVGSAEENVVKKIKEYFAFEYPYKNSTETIFKNSVSSINESGKPAKGQFVFVGEEEFIEKGNAYHLALKEIDFEKINSLEDVKGELEKISDEGVKKFVDCNLLYNNIVVLKQALTDCDKIFKEQQFTSLASLKEVFGEGEEEEIMLQGIVDLFGIGKKNVLIDYKYTSIKDEKLLKNKYKKQLLLYKDAIENGYGIRVDEVYLLSIKNNLFIKI